MNIRKSLSYHKILVSVGCKEVESKTDVQLRYPFKEYVYVCKKPLYRTDINRPINVGETVIIWHTIMQSGMVCEPALSLHWWIPEDIMDCFEKVCEL